MHRMSRPPDHVYYKGKSHMSLVPEGILNTCLSQSHKCKNPSNLWVVTIPWFSSFCAWLLLTSPQCPGALCPSSGKDRRCLILGSLPHLLSAPFMYLCRQDSAHPSIKTRPHCYSHAPCFPSLSDVLLYHLSSSDTIGFIYLFAYMSFLTSM